VDRLCWTISEENVQVPTMLRDGLDSGIAIHYSYSDGGLLRAAFSAYELLKKETVLMTRPDEIWGPTVYENARKRHAQDKMSLTLFGSQDAPMAVWEPEITDLIVDMICNQDEEPAFQDLVKNAMRLKMPVSKIWERGEPLLPGRKDPLFIRIE
jgi:hypothetical protein